MAPPPRSQHAGRRLVKRAIDHHQGLRSDVIEGREIGALGANYRAVVFDEECDESILVASASPGIAVCPGTRVATLAINGGSSRMAIEAAPPGRSGALPIESQEGEASVGSSSVAVSLGLRLTAFSGDEITFDIASFSGANFVELLHEGLVLTGIATSQGENAARRRLTTARSLVGVTGIPDGSIMLHCADITKSPDEYTIHVINIETGAVASRLYDPEFVPVPFLAQRIIGWDYLDNKLHFMFGWDGPTRVQIATFPPSLSSQTILADEGFFTPPGNPSFGCVFYADDAIFNRATALDTWSRMPYSGGLTDSYVTGVPDPGSAIRQHPYSLGLADGKFWTIGQGPSPPFTWDIKPFFTLDIDDVAANGWTDMAAGLGLGNAFYQFWNGQRLPGYDFNRDRTAIHGFPIFTSSGPDATDGIPGFMSLPLTATTWGDATFTEIDITEFRPDFMVGDGREA